MSTERSTTPLPQKLGIDGDRVYHVRHAPAAAATLLRAATGVAQATLSPAPIDVVIAFHTRREALLAEWAKLTAAVEPDGVVWVAWPKRGSGVATDLDGDAIRATLLPTGWVDNKICSIDDTWSALRFALRVERRRPRDAARKRR